MINPMPTTRLTETNRPHASPAVFAELDAGLRAGAACISPKFLYDALGSRLFEAICELPEYYPTRTEASIFARHGHEMARAIGPGSTLIDLGAGNCAKAAKLFPSPSCTVRGDRYLGRFPARVDRAAAAALSHIEMTGLGLDFSNSLALPICIVRPEKRLFFYPGSSIGNFTPVEANAFLRRARAQCDNDGGLLIGIDLVKDSATLDAAYDDALGVTAAFNLNLLRHVNHLAAADSTCASGAIVATTGRPGPGRDASRSARGAHRQLARRHARFRRARTDPHREQLQVPAKRGRRAARTIRVPGCQSLDRSCRLVRRDPCARHPRLK